MHYRLRKERIAVKSDASQLGVTSGHVLVANGCKLVSHGFAKPKEREWILDADITCLRVDGGPAGREGCLIGLANGKVQKIYVDNAFPVDVAQVEGAVLKIDTTCDRRKIAVVDADGRLRVLDPKTKEVSFSAEGAGSVCFNAQFDDMVCYTKKDHDELFVKTGKHAAQQHLIGGDVVGFVGAKLFMARDQKIHVVDLPQSGALAQHVDAGEFDRALRVACLGVTAADWRRLAEAAANALDLDTARAAYVRRRPKPSSAVVSAEHPTSPAAAPPADYPTARPASAEISPPRRRRRPPAERPPAGTAKSTTSGRSNF